MKKICITLIISLFALMAQAQNFEDIVRFSGTPNNGTARVSAMGGAFTALGGDISAITINPASVGVFRKSEVSFTPFVNIAKTKASGESPTKSSFQLGDLGLVISLYSPSFDWKGVNFSFNYTNLNNFNRKTRQIVETSHTSFTDVLARQSGTLSSDELDGMLTGLAYDAYLINPYYNEQDSTLAGYYSIFGEGEPVAQVKDISESGYQGEYTLSVGTNFKDKLYLGMSIGIQTLNYKKSSVYTEAPPEQSLSEVDFYTFEEYYKMNGVGTNLKFGIIYRPIPQVRIGASIHTPTWYSFDYSWSTRFYSQFITDYDVRTGRDQGAYDVPSYPYNIDCDMRTPWRANVGLATILGQKAIISADYEFVKYPNARYQHGEDDYGYYDYDIENADIEAYLRPTHNFRAGAEYRFNSIASLRAGYSFRDSPYHESHKANNRLQTVSAGVGLNFGSFYCDAAYSYKHAKNETIFYSYIDPNYEENDIYATPVSNKYLSHEIRLTFGIRF